MPTIKVYIVSFRFVCDSFLWLEMSKKRPFLKIHCWNFSMSAFYVAKLAHFEPIQTFYKTYKFSFIVFLGNRRYVISAVVCLLRKYVDLVNFTWRCSSNDFRHKCTFFFLCTLNFYLTKRKILFQIARAVS